LQVGFGKKRTSGANVDIVVTELFDMTVSQAVFEVQRVLDAHPGSTIRIVLDDEMHRHNVIKLLEKQGRTLNVSTQGQLVTIEVKSQDKSRYLPRAPVIQAEPKPAPIPPVLVLNSIIGNGDPLIGRRLLIEILRRADKQIPWIGIAHEGASILGDPAGLKVLHGLIASGVSVRISRECTLFYPEETSNFEIMEDSEWQTLLLKGSVTKF
jgi:hypothetical protein